MKRTIVLATCLLAAVGLYWFAQGGEMEPPGPPAPTMVTLQEVYDRVSASPVGIAKTGQTLCWDDLGAVIPCNGTGQDGEHQRGVAVNPRFVENGDGTVTDNLTGLVWLQDAACETFFAGDNSRENVRDLWDALIAAVSLEDGFCGLSDGSVPGDWHLPNVRELHSLIDYGQSNPALPYGGVPFQHVQTLTTEHLTSTIDYLDGPPRLCRVSVSGSGIMCGPETFGHVWPVRDR